MSPKMQITPSSAPDPISENRFGSLIGSTIFLSRWLQAPLYLGLIVAQCVYVGKFMKTLSKLVLEFNSLDEEAIMLLVLGLVDVVMIANLLIMVIIGGYETFVSRINMKGHRDEPEWLSHVNPNILKVKLAMSIIGISSVHLLASFIEARGLGTAKAHVTEAELMWKTIIHAVFILSAIGLAYIDRLTAAPVKTPHQPTPAADTSTA